MSYYGYPISPEELEKEKQKEREKREKRKQKLEDLNNAEKNEDIEEKIDEASSKFNEEDDIVLKEPITEEMDEYIDIDCSQCSENPSTCDKNCLAHLNKEYLATLIEEDDEEEENDEEENSEFVNKIKSKALCLEPTLLEKLKKDLCEEDFNFIKSEMKWYALIFFSTYFLGVALLCLSLKFNILFLTSLSLLVLFFPYITNMFLKGKYWFYIRKGLKRRKNPLSYESVLKEIPLYRANKLTIPKTKGPFIIYGFIFVLSIVILFVQK